MFNDYLMEDALYIFYEDSLSIPERKKEFKSCYNFEPTSNNSIGYISVDGSRYLVDISGRIKSTYTHTDSKKTIITLGQDFWRSDLDNKERHSILMHEIGHIKSKTDKSLYKDRNFTTDDMLTSIADSEEFKADRYSADRSSDTSLSRALDKVKNFHIDRNVNRFINKLKRRFNMDITSDMPIGDMMDFFVSNYPYMSRSIRPDLTYYQVIKRIYLREHPKINKAVRLRKRALREL